MVTYRSSSTTDSKELSDFFEMSHRDNLLSFPLDIAATQVSVPRLYQAPSLRGLL